MWKKFPFPYEDSFGVGMGAQSRKKYWRIRDYSQNLQPGLHIWVKAKIHEKFQKNFFKIWILDQKKGVSSITFNIEHFELIHYFDFFKK